MKPELRNPILVARVRDYLDIMRTAIFTLAGLAAIIELGPEGYSAPLTALVITATAYGILAGGTALDDLINLREDMDAETAKSAYGKGVAARNLPALKMTSAGLLALVGLAELYAIFV